MTHQQADRQTVARRGSRNRNAYTLIELAVTIAAGSTMMILAIGLVHQSMSLASASRGRIDHQRAVNRLAGEFRRDVHGAAEFNVSSPAQIEMTMPDDSVVTYEAQPDGVIRRQPLQGGDVRREAFAAESVSFASLDQPSRAVLTVVRQSPSSSQSSRIDRKVIAVLGRRLAHEQAEVSP